MLSALSNILKITELRQKIVFTLIMFAIFRLGTHIPVPGVNPAVLEQLFNSGNLFGLLDLFSGGALSKFSLFAMSITPYINASIIIQLLTVVIPTLEQWSKEGEEGHKKITKTTRYLTVVLAFLQAIGMSIGLKQAIINPSFTSIFIIAITLTAGTVFLMWIGEQITAHGVGNGISYFNVLFFGIIALAMIVFVIAINEGQRRVPVSYAKRVVGRKTYGGHSTHIPLKVNQAGVIPIIFASSVLMFPPTIAQFVQNPTIKQIADYFQWGTPFQSALYALLIIFFTYFYTAVTFKIPDLADNLKKYGGFIPGILPGIRPGQATADYLDRIMTRITLAGAFFLAFIAILPTMIAGATHIEGIHFGGTALLIVVGVALNTMQQIESMVVMRHYEGFMK